MVRRITVSSLTATKATPARMPTTTGPASLTRVGQCAERR